MPKLGGEKPLSINQLMNQILDYATQQDFVVRKVHVFYLPKKTQYREFNEGVDNKVTQEVFLNPVAILMNMKYEKLPAIHFKSTRTRHNLLEYGVNTLEIENDQHEYNGYTYYPSRVQYFTKMEPIYKKLFIKHRDDEEFTFSPWREHEADDYEDDILD